MDLSHALHIPTGFSDPTLWTILALFIFLGILFFLNVHKKITASLDERAQKIAHELEEARRLREQAQEALASYQRRQREAETEAQSIVDQAQKEAARMAESLREETRQRLEKRIEIAETKIAHAEQDALRKVRNIAADLAIDSLEMLLQNHAKKEAQAEFISQGIKDLDANPITAE